MRRFLNLKLYEFHKKLAGLKTGGLVYKRLFRGVFYVFGVKKNKLEDFQALQA